MSGSAQPIEWFVAREGRQHGPITDVELQMMVEQGHLRPTDLVWRAGMAEWQTAASMFQRPSPQPQPAPVTQRAEPPAGTDLRDAARQRPSQQVDTPAARTEPKTAGRGQQPSAQTPSRTASDAGARAPSAEDVMLAAIKATEAARSPMPVRPAPSQRQPDVEPRRAAVRYDDDDDDDADEAPRRRWGRMLAALLVVAALGGSGAWVYRTYGFAVPMPSITGLVKSGAQAVSAVTSSSSEHSTAALSTSPFQAKGEDAAALDGSFQQAAVWRVVKREFPDWYAERLKETLGMRTAKREDEAVTKHLAEALVTLRRKHADQALAAAPDRLRMVASGFLENLQSLAKHSVEACYGYISQGETNPIVLKLTELPAHASQMQKQVTAVFDAIADGRKSPRTYLPPRKTDYDALAQELTGRGWSQADLQTFSDPRSLARSSPAQVCKMVQDWFAAQIAIKDVEVRQRLLVESLRPVVAG